MRLEMDGDVVSVRSSLLSFFNLLNDDLQDDLQDDLDLQTSQQDL